MLIIYNFCSTGVSVNSVGQPILNTGMANPVNKDLILYTKSYYPYD